MKVAKKKLLDELRLAMESQRPFLRRRQAAPDVVAALESAGQLKAALATLWEDERQIVTLHHQESLTFTAIACQLALTIDSVRRCYKRAVVKLRLRMP